MPAPRRPRKAQLSPPVYSPTKPTGSNSGLVVPSQSPTAPTEPPAIVLNSDTTLGPNTPTREGDAVKQPLPLTNSPTDRDAPSIASSLSGDATPVEGTGPNHEGTPERATTKEKTASENVPVDSPDNLFKVSSPPSPQLANANTLLEAIQKTRQAAALRQASSHPLVWLTTPMGRTGAPILDHALDDLRFSRYCLWIGNAHRISANCAWVNSERSSTATLQWKYDAPNKLAHSEGDAIIGFLGTVSTDGLNLAPDAGWQPSWGEEKLNKQKRTFRTIYPGVSSNVPQSWWDAQFEGALRVVEDGCKSSKDGPYEVKHCFVDKQGGHLRVRSPLFLSDNAVQDGDEDDTGSTSSSEDSLPDVPKDFEYATWNISSRSVRDAFDRVIQQGYRPQVLEAYTRYNKLIHPNNVAATLAGAIVLVHCTLERMRFSRNNGRNTEFQFFANLVKVQVLKLAPPVKSLAATKRKFVHSYGPNDGFGPDGRSANGSTSSKRIKLAPLAH
ncbi:hypothetical protein FS749_002808 [Ceratobasidium sp. UAMH 11750]|nr:hypothetical protein FS749_002808 [Ceratobasidium sp. UAMH 11750]